MAQSEGYKTKQRDHILQFLIENQSRHVTVDDVVDHLKQSGNPVGNKEECAVHFHLKCITCKKLIHLNCDFMNGIEQHILKEHHFQVDSSRTVFYGQCEDCMKQSV